MKILYVEDEQIMREIFGPIIKGMVKECDFREAHSGNEAIKLLKENSDFDLIISDYQMPDGTGGELFQFLIKENLRSYFILFTNTIEPEIEEDNEKFLGIISKRHSNELIEAILKFQRGLSLSETE